MKLPKAGLTTKILIALLLGIVLGIVFHYCVPSGPVRDNILVGGVFKFCGQAFLRLMQMLVIPLVFCSLVCGASSIGDTKSLGKVGVSAICFYLCTTVIAVSMAIAIAHLINPGLGLNLGSTVQTTAATVAEDNPSFVDSLLEMVPTNPFKAMAAGDMLPVIVFALLVGICISRLGEKASTVKTIFAEFNDVMMSMTMMIMKLAPIGVFCLITITFSNIGFDAMLPLMKYIVCVILVLAIHLFGVYQMLLRLFSKLSPRKFIRKFAPVMGFAFSTATSNATIPLSIDTLDKKLGVSKKISSFTIPLGATLNMDGTAIMQGVAVVFVAQAFGIELGLSGYLTVILTATIASIGTAGVPGSAIVMLTMVFASVGLPIEGLSIIMGVDRIVDMCRTTVNITGDAVCTTIIAKRNGELDAERFNS